VHALPRKVQQRRLWEALTGRNVNVTCTIKLSYEKGNNITVTN
jgi:hypothetical protein